MTVMTSAHFAIASDEQTKEAAAAAEKEEEKEGGGGGTNREYGSNRKLSRPLNRDRHTGLTLDNIQRRLVYFARSQELTNMLQNWC
jgi:hypothetical protein